MQWSFLHLKQFTIAESFVIVKSDGYTTTKHFNVSLFDNRTAAGGCRVMLKDTQEVIETLTFFIVVWLLFQYLTICMQNMVTVILLKLWY